MPFLNKYYLILKKSTITNLCNNYMFSCREEDEFDFLHYLIAISCKREKASVSASVTVEAVFCIPLFVYATVCLIWILELRNLQSTVRSGLQDAGKQRAESFLQIPVLNPAELAADVVNAVGREKLDASLICGGSGGIRCEKSYYVPGTGIMELTAEYEAKIPIPFFQIPLLKYKETMRMKAWTGYVKSLDLDMENHEIVYITETGIVYHKDYHCTYLEPSVQMVTVEALDTLRNNGGGIYHPCERCRWQQGKGGVCYITDYGDRYHTTASCSGLKRSVYAVTLSEAKGKGACSKCGGR